MAHIRPLSYTRERNDFSEVTGVVSTDMINGDQSKTVESIEIFGNPDITTDSQQRVILNDVYSRKGVIKLIHPVVNYLTLGKKLQVVTRLFDREFDEGNSNEEDEDKQEEKDKATLIKFARGSAVYDNLENQVLTGTKLNEAYYDPERYQLGADYLKHLIEEFDVNEELELYLKSAVRKCLAKIRCDLESVSIIITRGGGDLWLVDDYYVSIAGSIDIGMLDKTFSIWRENALNRKLNRLTLLLSLRDNGKSTILDSFQSQIIVIPIGFRPKYNKMRDALTIAYNAIVFANEQLAQIVSSYKPKMRDVVSCYQRLVSAVETVQVEVQNSYDKNTKPIYKLLSGKTGFIRDKMLGVRSDYTGRAVIIVNPELSIEEVGIPITMAEKLYELRALKKYGETHSDPTKLLSGGMKNERELRKCVQDIADYIVIGRQPTLYRLGLQGFKVKVLPTGNAIELNPLCTSAFNADFDGDQMHSNAPISDEAREEVEKLMLITNNIYLGRSGECHIAPRQEIIYGLWKAQTAELTGEYRDCPDSFDELRQHLIKKEWDINDKVFYQDREISVGECGLRLCLPVEDRRMKLGAFNKATKKISVSESWFKKYLGKLGERDKRQFVSTVDNLVKLGFIVAERWVPSIPVLYYPTVKDMVDEFNESMQLREDYFNRGFESENDFSVYYDDKCNDLKNRVIKVLVEGFKSTEAANGYYEMMVSGARGKDTNLLQTFGMKGRVTKNSVESFNTLISSSLVEQMSGLESFICSFSGRQGLIDKSIETYGPGYLSRQMQHVASPVIITNEDCGTKEGLPIDFDFIKTVLGGKDLSGDDAFDNNTVRDFVTKLLIGRYIIEESEKIETEEQAKQVYKKYVGEIIGHKDDTVEFVKKPGLHLRSPITCSNPCCVKCYGTYLGTHKEVVVGTPVGFEAATSIGEPGTQLTMKNFQSGGIAGQKNLTSSYATLEGYLHIKDLADDAKNNTNYVYNHDWISNVSGYVKTIGCGDGTVRLMIVDEHGDKLRTPKIKYPENKKLKECVHKGESILQVQEDYSIPEVIRERGVDEGVRYLTLFLYNLFNKEVEVNLKHFEVLISGMVMYVCTKGNDYFKTGHYYSNIEYNNHNREGCKFYKRLLGLKSVPLLRDDVFAGLEFENIGEGLIRSLHYSGKDEMKLPLVRYMFGLKENFGSVYPNYISERCK